MGPHSDGCYTDFSCVIHRDSYAASEQFSKMILVGIMRNSTHNICQFWCQNLPTIYTIIIQEFQGNMIEYIKPLWLMDLIMDRQNVIFTTSPVRKLEEI